jgi:hypothetical protein
MCFEPSAKRLIQVCLASGVDKTWHPTVSAGSSRLSISHNRQSNIRAANSESRDSAIPTQRNGKIFTYLFYFSLILIPRLFPYSLRPVPSACFFFSSYPILLLFPLRLSLVSSLFLLLMPLLLRFIRLFFLQSYLTLPFLLIFLIRFCFSFLYPSRSFYFICYFFLRVF